MDIDLSLLHSRTIDELDISGDYLIPEEYYKDTDIKKIEDINVDGYITYDEEDHINCRIKGNIVIEDSISLENIDYPIDIEYDDKIEETHKKNENILDIFSFLCENIVLEVPLQFTKVEDLSKFHGDGWRLIDEDEASSQNNPFLDLLKDNDKE